MAIDWEPSYGFTKTDAENLAAALEVIRRKVCCYGELSTTCDCKYGIGERITPVGTPIKKMNNSEQTGCPELRSVIRILLHGTVEFDVFAHLAKQAGNPDS